MAALTKKEKEKFWKSFNEHLRADPSPTYVEIMLNSYYQKQFNFIREFMIY